jgi:RNA polymerase sigma factor (sigma-70 family)
VATSSDAELVERARQGDADAYGELVRRYQDQALATAFFILGNRQEAEDATQEAFTRAFAALARFRPDGSFRPWLLRIIVNEAHDVRAAAQRQAELLARAAEQLPTVTPSPSAEASALGVQRREALLRALFELREDDRLVITYRYFFDFSEADTADALGIARGTVKSRLARALARLGPVVRKLGPLVVVGPSLESALDHVLQELRLAPEMHARPEMANAIVQQLGPGADPRSARSQLARQAGPAIAAATATLTVIGVFLGTLALTARSRELPRDAMPPPRQQAAAATDVPPSPPPAFFVYGDDLTDADRQEVATLLGAQGAPVPATVSRAELASTLRQQGLPVSPNDRAISSARLTCLGARSGLSVQTYNIVGISAPVYAAAMMTAGVFDGSLLIVAPSSKPVTGEAALVGALKAAPGCGPHAELDSNRVRLAYAQLKAIQGIAGDSLELARASVVFLNGFHAVVTGQAQNDARIENVLDVAAAQQHLVLDDTHRAELVSVLQQVHGLDFGEYANGYGVDQPGPDRVRIFPTETN